MLGGFLLGAVQIAGAVQFSISDPVEFSQIINTNAVFTTNINYLKNTLLEGPVWIPNGQYLVFSEVDSNHLVKLVPPNTLTTFLSPPAGANYNGNILDVQERLISCECGSSGFQIVMTTNGVIVPLVTKCNGLKFISPNDVCVKSDGSIWFTDTGANSGISAAAYGYQAGYYVYRFYETNGNATVVPVITSGIQRPNGICFSPDETKLYVADDGINWNLDNIMVYNVTSSNTLTGGKLFCTVNGGFADGFRCDRDGRIWSTSGEGVDIIAPDGHRIGAILMGNRPNNLCFGGTNYQTLFMAAEPDIYSFPVLVAGAAADKKVAAHATGTNFYVSWPAPSTGFHLQAANSLGAQAGWNNVTNAPQATNGWNQVGLPATNAAAFFRLQLN